MIYRVDLHVHTSATEGVSASLDELVRAARRAGLDAIAVTDRDICTPVPVELRGILLIPGCEISTLGGQILGVFLDQPLDFARLRRDGLPTADEAVIEIHRCGGLAILANPFAKKDANPALFPIRPDAVETANARAAMRNPEANKRALLWAADHQRPSVGSSNAHSPQELGNAYTEIACRRLSRAFLKDALDLGHCRPVFVRDTKRPLFSPRSSKAAVRSAPRKKNTGSLLRRAAVSGANSLVSLRQRLTIRRKPPKKD